MQEHNIFVSVGGTTNPRQEDFVLAIEDRLRSEGLIPHTIGRNTFSADAPLKAVLDLLKTCSGTVVIALERSYFPSGLSKRGSSSQVALADIKLPTPWNQIEAAISYSLNLPLMVVVETELKQEGLLERGYDWYVQETVLERNALTSREFNGVLASWKEKVLQKSVAAIAKEKVQAIDDLTIGSLISLLKPAQLWSILTTIATIVAGAFALGVKLHSFR